MKTLVRNAFCLAPKLSFTFLLTIVNVCGNITHDYRSPNGLAASFSPDRINRPTRNPFRIRTYEPARNCSI